MGLFMASCSLVIDCYVVTHGLKGAMTPLNKLRRDECVNGYDQFYFAGDAGVLF